MIGYRPAQIVPLVRGWLEEPLPALRVEIVRIIAPLAVLGFMSGRIAHADELLGTNGFHVPDLGYSDWRQVLYVPPLPNELAWAIAATMVVSGLLVSIGYKPRQFAVVFAATLAFCAVADRMAAFTVSKLSPVVMLALAASGCGERLSLDLWLARRKGLQTSEAWTAPDYKHSGAIRFYQFFLPTMYCASGIAKARGDWLRTPDVVWSHLHDSYQTAFSYWLVTIMPRYGWTLFQWMTLGFEMGAPLWFLVPRFRTPAMIIGLGMHLMIALQFGPVKYFAFLMMAMLLGAYLPDDAVEWLGRWARRVDGPNTERAPEDPAPKRKKKRRRKKAKPAADDAAPELAS